MNRKELYFGQCKIVIHRPDLNPIDKARIEQGVRSTLEAVMRSYIYRKEKQNGVKDASGAIATKQIPD